MAQVCERCEEESVVTTMSMFNTQHCCPECIEKERDHPDFPDARAAELDALQAGNYNYPGIGLPSDLNPKT